MSKQTKAEKAKIKAEKDAEEAAKRAADDAFLRSEKQAKKDAADAEKEAQKVAVAPATPGATPVVPQTPPPTAAEAKKAAKAFEDEESVDVIRPKANQYIRTFSREIHGDDFLALAQQCAGKPMYAKREYAVVGGSTIKEVQVRYREKQDFDLPLDEQKPDSPIVDKVRRFKEKEEALAFATDKKGTCVISVPKK